MRRMKRMATMVAGRFTCMLHFLCYFLSPLSQIFSTSLYTSCSLCTLLEIPNVENICWNSCFSLAGSDMCLEFWPTRSMKLQISVIDTL
ncbi:hypothetical protein F4776DRAFT_589007 [Hypoxylon sp. NC0597]|nr:hypothetical protein F4776DRAFT_589007 [Hypoxylon sp. NC0597]